MRWNEENLEIIDDDEDIRNLRNMRWIQFTSNSYAPQTIF